MISTKSEILALLKRNGRHSVGELAQELKLAPVTIRQHLTHLERDGLVVAERGSDSAGRSHYLFRLTAKARLTAATASATERFVSARREVKYLGKIVVEELRGDFSVVNPDDPEAVQDEAIARTNCPFPRASSTCPPAPGVPAGFSQAEAG